MKLTKSLMFIVLMALVGRFALAESEVAELPRLSQPELDQILAPIALYPDTILSHILIASVYPLDVIKADRWLDENPDLEGEAALLAVAEQAWEPSVKALVPFPRIIQQMSGDLEWTEKLGAAFRMEEERVMASIQALRTLAYREGSLDQLEHLEVEEEEGNIVIETREREIVYVPYYDPFVVYGHWRWIDYPPVFWSFRLDFPRFRISFGPRIHVGSGFYFSGCHWRNRRVVVIDHFRGHNHWYHDYHYVARHPASYHWVHRPVRYQRPYQQVVHHHHYSADAVSHRIQKPVRPAVRPVHRPNRPYSETMHVNTGPGMNHPQRPTQNARPTQSVQLASRPNRYDNAGTQGAGRPSLPSSQASAERPNRVDTPLSSGYGRPSLPSQTQPKPNRKPVIQVAQPKPRPAAAATSSSKPSYRPKPSHRNNYSTDQRQSKPAATKKYSQPKPSTSKNYRQAKPASAKSQRQARSGERSSGKSRHGKSQ